MSAINVGYDNSQSGIEATNLQEALDEISGYLGQLEEI